MRTEGCFCAEDSHVYNYPCLIWARDLQHLSVGQLKKFSILWRAVKKLLIIKTIIPIQVVLNCTISAMVYMLRILALSGEDWDFVRTVGAKRDTEGEAPGSEKTGTDIAVCYFITSGSWEPQGSLYGRDLSYRTMPKISTPTKLYHKQGVCNAFKTKGRCFKPRSIQIQHFNKVKETFPQPNRRLLKSLAFNFVRLQLLKPIVIIWVGSHKHKRQGDKKTQ